jgi:non-lysosomal glucosylceramidase
MHNRSPFTLALCLISLVLPDARAGADDLLSQLSFKNSGIVRRDMQFEYKLQDCYYVELDNAWSNPWGSPFGKPIGGGSYPYLYRVDSAAGAKRLVPPPIGMRSAVPLGGLGAGTVELRADGSFHDWNIFNNSPGGGNKIQFDGAFLGLRVKSSDGKARAWALCTHPPQKLPAISEIEYSGAFPVSRLRFRDPDLPIKASLYAYSTLKIRDARASAAPAVIFTLVLTNPTAKPVEAALLFNLPNHIRGVVSAKNGLHIDRPGTEPTSGSMVVRCGDDSACSFAAGNDVPQIWKAFATDGRLGGLSASENARYGAIATNISLGPNETRSFDLVLAWHFPNRPHAGRRVGNYYTKLYRDADAVADTTMARLADIQRAVLQWQQLCFDNSLPAWLQDAMPNSVAMLAKTGIWLEDGRWRQWESFSCPTVDPMHIEFYRSLPYALLFPELEESILRGFASTRRSDGCITEHLGLAGRPMGDGDTRILGDCASTFILDTYKHYLWNGGRRCSIIFGPP